MNDVQLFDGVHDDFKVFLSTCWAIISWNVMYVVSCWHTLGTWAGNGFHFQVLFYTLGTKYHLHCMCLWHKSEIPNWNRQYTSLTYFCSRTPKQVSDMITLLKLLYSSYLLLEWRFVCQFCTDNWINFSLRLDMNLPELPIPWLVDITIWASDKRSYKKWDNALKISTEKFN